MNKHFIVSDAVFTVILILYSAFTLLYTFVFPHGQVSASTPSVEITAEAEGTEQNAVLTDSSYETDQVKISIETIRVNGTSVYLADVVLSNADQLRTAFAFDTYGRNVKAKTSEIASENNAVLAINGDYYGFRDSGFVVRNGVVFRASVQGDGINSDLFIDMNGDFSILSENEENASLLEQMKPLNVFSFGPALVEDGAIVVGTNDEVDQSMRTNPRTAIGQIGPLHYLFMVSDGRTSESTGLSLYALAKVMADAGCMIAYNLDGGGSSTMIFNGSVVNNPTTNGRSISERSVSDILYISY